MPEVVVTYEGGTRFSAACEGFTVRTGKGEDGDPSRDGMSPAQLFVASLGMCIGRYVLSYCQHHEIPHGDLILEVDRETEHAPARTSRVVVTIRLGAPLSEKQAEAILKVADRCHVTNSIRQPAEVVCRLAGQGG